MSSVIRGCAVRQVEVLEVDSGGQGSRSEEGRMRVPQQAVVMVLPGWACLPGQMGIGDSKGWSGLSGGARSLGGQCKCPLSGPGRSGGRT